MHTVTVTFNGTETHYKKVEHGEVVSHEDWVALSIVFSWEPVTGALSVFSEDKQARATLAGIFRDVLLSCDDEIGSLPLRQFDLSAFAHHTMVQRLAEERVEGVETIALLHLKVARPFWHRNVLEASEGGQTMQHLASHLVVMRDRLVRRAISLIDSPSRKYIRRIFPNIAMVITSITPEQEMVRTG